MGLDSVNLLVAIEEEFRIAIDNSDAEKMCTVGDIYTYLRNRLSKTPPGPCLTQVVFYRLRQALMRNLAVSRRSIRPYKCIGDVMCIDDIRDGWPWVEMSIGLKMPDFEISREFLGFKKPPILLTPAQLVRKIIELNPCEFPPERVGDNEEIWNRLVEVFLREVCVDREDLVPEARIGRDLGID